ncbi:hypothetical protein; ATPase motif [Cupriavidus taiwanensis LMG 19424]|uniref:Uncharacterized protein n=2 Tax=Cupriavidus taiwanensis TaxID=164546 RepID=B3R3D2_CUPTR|nr:hypothetical protein; ATPase motif [Cupriavidus taiwanensis LMG 19424]
MRFFRGPEGKSLEDPSYEGVGTYEFSMSDETWTGTTTIRINIAKDKSAERQSALYVAIDEADVLMLHKLLLKGLREKIAMLEEDERQVQAAQKKASGRRKAVATECVDLSGDYSRQTEKPSKKLATNAPAAEWPFPIGSRP